MRKDEITNQIIEILKAEKKQIPVTNVLQKMTYYKDNKEEVLSLFEVKNFSDIFKLIDKVSLFKNEHGTQYVSYAETSTHTETVQSEMTDKLRTLLKEINAGLFEKDEAIRLAFLCVICGESIFFMGPPGTAKSMISRRVKEVFKEDINYFEYLMNEFSTPDEICGPVSLKELSEKDRYVRLTKGYLPKAHIAFLDEIWKSGPAILNTLLTIINEKIFHNGDTPEKVPLQSLIAASNEFPAKNRGLEALWDRFVVRVMVNPVKSEESFYSLCEKSEIALRIPDELKLDFTTIKSYKSKIENIKLGENIKEIITAIRKELVIKNTEKERANDEKYYISDRRWKRIIHILKSSAFLNQRESVDLMDCQLIRYCIWGTQKQYGEVQKIVGDIVKAHGLECTTTIEDINDRIKKYDNYIDDIFYETVPDKPIPYKMNDDYNAYKIMDNKQIESYEDITPYYICTENVHGRTDRIGAYYDKEKEIIGDYYYALVSGSIIITGDTITFIDFYKRNYNKKNTLTIEMKKDGLQKKPSLFEKAEILKPLSDQADKDFYIPIKTQIDSEMQKLADLQISCEKPFSENLFAEPQFKNIITSKMEDAKQLLENAQIALDKERSRYKD